MAVLLGPLWAAAVVLAVLGDRPERGEWEVGLCALAAAAALAVHLDRLLGIVSVGLDVKLRRRITALPPVAVGVAVALAVGAGQLEPTWTAASRLACAAVGLFSGLASIAIGTRGGPVFYGFGGAKRKDGWVALSWVAEDDAVPALLVIAGLVLALSLEEGVSVVAGGGAAAAAYWVGLRAVLRRRLLARIASRVASVETWALVPASLSPLAWRLLTREGDLVVETVLTAPSGAVRATHRYRAADTDPDLRAALTRIALRPPHALVISASRAPDTDARELVELIHGPADRPGPGRIRFRGTKPASSSTD